MNTLKLTGYEPVSEIAFLKGTSAGEPFMMSKKSSMESPQPIEVDGFYIPDKFGMRLYFSSFKKKTVEWCTTLEIEVGKDGIPRTVSMSVSGDSFSVQDNQRRKLASLARVEKNHLELVAQELRRLEALSVSIAAELWTFDFETKQWVFYFFDNPQDLAQNRRDLKALEKQIMNRTAYRKIDNHFQERISSLFEKAVKDGVSPYAYIMEVIGREESRVISLKTVQRWVTTARKNGFLRLTIKKKVSAKKVGSKTKTKAKKGE
jgi:hypothetical protein